MIVYSDLDNTMIYSLRRSIGEDKVCVEYYEGKEHSFMTTKAYHLLKVLNGEALFVPTTTRTIDQYKRINLGIGTPRYALVCNGGVLLVDGEKDTAWYKASLEIAQSCQDDLVLGEQMLEQDPHRIIDVKRIEDLFLFTKSSEPEKTAHYLKEKLDSSRVTIYLVGSKVYIIPNKLSKGAAIERLGKMLGAAYSIAIGDSKMDESMMVEVNEGILHKEQKVTESIQGDVVYLGEETVFSDEALVYILKRVEEIKGCKKRILG